jgi:uncharacterized membrane protein
MQGKATLADHPIHPMLVGFPIGFFGAVLVSDVISIWGNPAFWPHVSTWLIAFGVVGALLAALFGFVDYFTAPMSRAVKRTATTHMVPVYVGLVGTRPTQDAVIEERVAGSMRAPAQRP